MNRADYRLELRALDADGLYARALAVLRAAASLPPDGRAGCDAERDLVWLECGRRGRADLYHRAIDVVNAERREAAEAGRRAAEGLKRFPPKE